MGILDRIFRRQKPVGEPSAEEVRFKRVAAEPPVSVTQEKTNRDVMEAQMTESRAKRDADDAAKQ